MTSQTGLDRRALLTGATATAAAVAATQVQAAQTPAKTSPPTKAPAGSLFADVATTNGKLNKHISLGNNIANGMYLLVIRSASENMVFHLVVEQ